MNDIELLKKIPKEHYTLQGNKLIKVEDLLKILIRTDKNRESKQKSS